MPHYIRIVVLPTAFQIMTDIFQFWKTLIYNFISSLSFFSSALVLDLVVSGTLKAIVRRPRPSTNSSSDMFFVVSVDHFSFPSGHTTRATMLAVLALIRLPLSVLTQYLSIVWAFCIAASRVMLGRHHLSDVFFGAIIGYVQALAVQHYWFEVNDVDGILQLFKLWKS